MKPYSVYVEVDDDGRIVNINSDAFQHDFDNWTKIDEGYTQRYHHAQSSYLPNRIRDERGICRYKLVDGKPVERTQEEMDADYASRPAHPSDAERLTALEQQNAELSEQLAAAKILLGLEE
jgi:hypothetical protein